MKKTITILLLALLAGCATPPPKPASGAMVPLDDDTEYSVTPTADGYTVAVNFARYQFVPQMMAVKNNCTATAIMVALDHAKKAGRKVQINEAQMHAEAGRNILTGVSSCTASLPVRWDGGVQ